MHVLIKGVFRQQTIAFVIADAYLSNVFSITFGVTDFSDADKRLSADHSHANLFPRTAVVKPHDLSITDARQSMLVLRVWAIRHKCSENKVKLSSASSNTSERSSCSDDDKSAPRIEQNSILKHLQAKMCYLNKILEVCFEKRDDKLLSNTNSLISIKLVSKNEFTN